MKYLKITMFCIALIIAYTIGRETHYTNNSITTVEKPQHEYLFSGKQVEQDSIRIYRYENEDFWFYDNKRETK